MQRDAAIELIKSRLTRAGTTELDATIITEMQFAQATVCEGAPTLPWFLLHEDLTLSISAGASSFALPAGFLREADEGGLWSYNADTGEWVPIVKEDLSYLVATQSGLAATRPGFYAIVDETTAKVFPTADIDYTLKAVWYVKDAALTGDIENKWLKHAADVLVAETGIIVARDILRDMSAADTFTAMRDRAWERLWRVHEGHAHANRTYSMGD